MRRIFLPFVMLVSALFVFGSCLKSDDDEVTYYNDTAISAFSLGTLNRYLHTTSSTGEDSVYNATVTGSNYKFYIDQLTHEIYNVDSLPVNTDVAHVICTISSKNGGLIGIKNVDSDTTKYYSSTDSIDFTQPREIRAYAGDGSGYRAYTVRVNVHQEEADVFRWTALPTNSDIAALENMQAVCNDGRVYVRGVKDGSEVCLSTGEADGRTWTVATWPGDDDFSVAGMQLEDADEAAFLPAQDIQVLRLPKKTNVDVWQALVVGNRSVTDYPADSTAVVWTRVEDAAANVIQPWMFMAFSAKNPYKAPRLRHLQVVVYGGSVLAIGGEGLGACTAEAFSQIYVSNDNGITWQSDSRYSLPDGFTSSSSSFAMTVDSDNYLWILCGESGQVWRGRLSQLGWANYQKAFNQ